MITKNSVLNNPFNDFDEEVPEVELKLVKETVEEF